MRIVVIGGTGLVGSKLVDVLTGRGHQAVPASPRSGVNSVTGKGLTEALTGAAVVVDVSNSPSFDDSAAMEFFRTSTTNLLTAERLTGVTQHVALSVVGTERLAPQSGYFQAKLMQEELIGTGPIPYSLVRATQFFEFLPVIADAATEAGTVRLPPALIQPMAAVDVAEALARTALGDPVNSSVEIAGPQRFALDELIRELFAARGDRRAVLRDADAKYWGIEVGERTLIPGHGATVFGTSLAAWLNG
ncbi:LysR family transcriptional regulator [Mycolicibacterium chitae]|uniref:Putative nucleoside-diphosphate sugar epimerase n=1 Tax=Mycolicibacterium chitae TaxID=1792 RepID=A0A448I509_MYCCI|nr:SDR family oxidoreductase [Mycolicibacterium chitae]MCV7106634.1 SDR family oxidoreductase [Mycolicibacterium chitae]BBZ03955.1 LysR family transcriptional regulator [Mycolicibacterium chitae]VEG47607.1 putative nucleoside-diphosphate sugar epimerase [Mycolicibacterium chitae]